MSDKWSTSESTVDGVTYYYLYRNGGSYSAFNDSLGTGSIMTAARFFSDEGRRYYMLMVEAREQMERISRERQWMVEALVDAVKRRNVRSCVNDIVAKYGGQHDRPERA